MSVKYRQASASEGYLLVPAVPTEQADSLSICLMNVLFRTESSEFVKSAISWSHADLRLAHFSIAPHTDMIFYDAQAGQRFAAVEGNKAASDINLIFEGCIPFWHPANLDMLSGLSLGYKERRMSTSCNMFAFGQAICSAPQRDSRFLFITQIERKVHR